MGSFRAHWRLRSLLLIGILVVSGLTVSSYLARQRLRRAFRPLPPAIAAGVDQQTQSFSLSKSLGGQALYKIQAKEVTNFKDTGKTLLRDVSIEVYGKQGNRQDHVTSQECEFDPTSGSLFFPGKVEMDLQAAAETEDTGNLQPSGPTHVVTSALHFNQNTGNAETDQKVQFRFTGGEGVSQGAIYEPQGQMITLKAQARFKLWKSGDGDTAVPGTAPEGDSDEDVTLVQSSSLRFRRGEGKLLLTAPVEVTQGTRQLQAGDSQILLDDQQRAQKAVLRGGVHGVNRNPLLPAEVEAAAGDIDLTQRGKVQQIVLESGPGALASFAAASARSVRTGQAQRFVMSFDEVSGQLSRVTALGKVRVVLSPVQPGAAAAKLPLLPALLRKTASPGQGSRVIIAQQAEMDLAEDGETPREVRTRSSSSIQLFPDKTGGDQRAVQGDHFTIQFGPDGDLSEFTAEQKVRLSAEGPNPAARNRVSSSDHLWAAFDSRTHSVSQMRQWGNFTYQDPDRQASAERADYAADGDVIRIQGQPMVWNASGRLTALNISLVNSTGEVDAEKQVSTTFFPAASPGNPPPEPAHVTADSLEYHSKTEKALYQGNARLWQGSDLIEADWLELDRQQQTLAARNNVSSVFPGRSQAGDQPAAARKSPLPGFGTGPIEIHSSTLAYSDREHRARYQGEVRMHNDSATLTSHELEIFFATPAPGRPPESAAAPALAVSGGNWQIERAVATGQVLVMQPGRKATGDRVEYFPAENKVILSGNLAAISDDQKGSSQGVRLTYFTSDDRILVQGEPGSPVETQRPVQR